MKSSGRGDQCVSRGNLLCVMEPPSHHGFRDSQDRRVYLDPFLDLLVRLKMLCKERYHTINQCLLLTTYVHQPGFCGFMGIPLAMYTHTEHLYGMEKDHSHHWQDSSITGSLKKGCDPLPLKNTRVENSSASAWLFQGSPRPWWLSAYTMQAAGQLSRYQIFALKAARSRSSVLLATHQEEAAYRSTAFSSPSSERSSLP